MRSVAVKLKKECFELRNEQWVNRRFGERLKTEREAKGWSQPRLVELLEAEGINWHVSTVAKVEGGHRSVRIVEAVALADVFSVPLDTLMGRAAGPADADLAIALRVLRDGTQRAADQCLDFARDIRQQVRGVVDGFDFESADELGTLAKTAQQRLDSAYDAVQELALATEETLKVNTSAARKQAKKAKAARA